MGVDEEDLPPLPVPPTTQHGQVVVKALTKIALGVAVVVVLAHPLVACFYEISYRFSVPPFYTAFVLGPLIGDSGVRVYDVIKYGRLKTAQATSVALTALYVCSAVSNTFVFGVLVAIVFNRGTTHPLDLLLTHPLYLLLTHTLDLLTTHPFDLFLTHPLDLLLTHTLDLLFLTHTLYLLTTHPLDLS